MPIYSTPPDGPAGQRFDTHDFSDISTWDCRTHGRPLLEKLLPSYPDATYDDVRYRVVRADGTVLAQLDGLVTTYLYDGSPLHRLAKVACGRKWRDHQGNALFEYQPDPAFPNDRAKGSWVWVADGTSMTDSTWLIDPYNGVRLRLRQALSGSEAGAYFQDGGAIRYQIRVMNGAAIAGEYVYDSVEKLIRNADAPGKVYQTPSGATIQEFVYNYEGMELIELDSAMGMTMEISLDENLPILGTETSYGAFMVQEFGVRQ